MTDIVVTQPEKSQPLSLRRHFIQAAVGLVLVSAVFAGGLDNQLVSDDWVFLHKVAEVRTAAGLWDFFSFQTGEFVRPLQLLVTWVLYTTAGLRPIPYHLVSLGLHLLNTVLLGWLLHSITTKWFTPRGAAFVTIATCVLFATQQVHHEAVFWFSSINELLAVLFRLCCLVLVWHALVTTANTARVLLFGLAWFSFGLALLSKESAIALLPELLLFYLLLPGTGIRGNTYFKSLLGFFVPCLLLAVTWFWGYVVTAQATSASGEVVRSGLRVILPTEASPMDWTARYLQFLTAYFPGIRRFAFMERGIVFGSIMLACLVLFAIRARQWLWLFALTWFLIAVTPYVVTTSTDALDTLQIPLRLIGAGGNRYLYYAAAPLSFWLVLTLYWWGSVLGTHLNQKWLSSTTVMMAGVALLTVANVLMLAQHEQGWEKSGQIVQCILVQTSDAIRTAGSNETVCLVDIPDNVDGKFVFRNGLFQAIDLFHGQHSVMIRAYVQPANEYYTAPVVDLSQCTPDLMIRWQ